MLNLSPNLPIGIFDSGIGGLTIARAIKQYLPNERFIYFGDTAHFPYGDKSSSQIQSYCLKISDWFVEQNCKMIVIACSSASTAALARLQTHIGQHILLVDVVDPLIQYLNLAFSQQTLGLIGTLQTVSSNMYQQKLAEINPSIKLHSLATPLLAPAIEENANTLATQKILHDYLLHPHLQDIRGLILGCTHYPLIIKEFEAFYQQKIELIDPSQLVASQVARSLTEHNLLNQDTTPFPKSIQYRYFVSHYHSNFAKHEKLLAEEQLPLEHFPLWE